ncbi:hypothetical protein DLAC_09609 [Tieghemostelium lacteum]|uniref:FNIP repeat-containing protein n=1 Tax=Tieghemostelium lacteum TaxID=361077 RepID=A0A151Z6Q5_TIELA|nr:hypothetical protein DLAC_09609 [Tieghemostelium lacteum]|eukprot:KYQ89643.1 hypothetical protein DLAC_09609 [Tieghemostelium lacteum]
MNIQAIKEIVYYLYSNVDILNLVSVNKEVYSKLRDSIRYHQFPIEYFSEVYSLESIPKKFKNIIMSKPIHFRSFFSLGVEKLELLDIDGILDMRNVNFQDDMVLNFFPRTITELSLPMNFKVEIPSGTLPKTLQTLNFPYDYDKPLPSDISTLPLKKLTIGRCVNPLEAGQLPKTLEKLRFREFNQKIVPGLLPDGLKSLKLPYSFSQEIDWLPPSIETLYISQLHNHPLILGTFQNNVKRLVVGSQEHTLPLNKWCFPKSLKEFECQIYRGANFDANCFPEGLETLKIVYGISGSIGKYILPESLKTFYMGDYFDSPIEEGVLPQSLTKLVIGSVYNHPLPKLPPSIEYVHIGRAFNQDLSVGIFPPSLKELYFDRYFYQPFAPTRAGTGFNNPLEVGVLSNTQLTQLLLGNEFNQDLLPNALPVTLKELWFGSRFNRPLLPGCLSILYSLTYLSFGYDFDQPLQPGILPQTLKTLIFGSAFNQSIEIGVLPQSLKSLKFGNTFNQPILPNSLPESLEDLELGYHFNQPLLPNTLPKNLQKLVFIYQFNQPLEVGVLPETLKELKLPNHFNQPLLPNVLPKSLKRLEFQHSYNQPLSVGVLPDSLETISFSKQFNQPISGEGILPSKLLNLRLGVEFQQDITSLPSTLRLLLLRKEYKSKNTFESPFLKTMIWTFENHPIIRNTFHIPDTFNERYLPTENLERYQIQPKNMSNL